MASSMTGGTTLTPFALLLRVGFCLVCWAKQQTSEWRQRKRTRQNEGEGVTQDGVPKQWRSGGGSERKGLTRNRKGNDGQSKKRCQSSGGSEGGGSTRWEDSHIKV